MIAGVEAKDRPSTRETAPAHVGILFNHQRDTILAQSDDAMSVALHVLDRHWHGIRSATACLPGGKLAISHKNRLTADELHAIDQIIVDNGYRVICYQGYSETADSLASHFHQKFGRDLRQCAVTHVTTSQFEHHFEISMLHLIHEKLESGVIARVGSVKPNFHVFYGRTWPQCIFNLAPSLSRIVLALPERETGTVFIPVENTWRKNLYTQVIAAQRSAKVNRICLVNWPSCLEQAMILDKVQVLGFQRFPELLAYMRLAQLVANVSFSECQPMTQLEALAVGTPAIVGPLRLPGFSDHPLSRLCEVTELDDPGLLRHRIDMIFDEWSRDPSGLSELIQDFLKLRVDAGIATYREFLEL